MRENTRSCGNRPAVQFTEVPNSSVPAASGAGAAKLLSKSIEQIIAAVYIHIPAPGSTSFVPPHQDITLKAAP